MTPAFSEIQKKCRKSLNILKYINLSHAGCQQQSGILQITLQCGMNE